MARLRPLLRVRLLCVMAVAISGCGSAGTPRTVQLSLAAPVNGATVTVHRIEVLGTIRPKGALVIVSGRRAHVVDGAFTRPLFLRKGVTRIKIVVRAAGYLDSTTEILVRYAPRARARPASAGNALAQSQTVTATTHRRVPPPSSVGSTMGTEFVAGCSRGNVTAAGCMCVYEQLVKRRFGSSARWAALAEQWRQSFLLTGVIRYPPAFKASILACASKFRR